MVPYMKRPGASNKTKTTVYLEEVDYSRLQRIARQRGTSAALLVREAIAEYTARHDVTTVPRSIGTARSGRKDMGARAEDLLEGMGES